MNGWKQLPETFNNYSSPELRFFCPLERTRTSCDSPGWVKLGGGGGMVKFT